MVSVVPMAWCRTYREQLLARRGVFGGLLNSRVETETAERSGTCSLRFLDDRD